MSVFDDIKLPKVIFSAESPYSGKVEVWQSGHTTKLVADGTVQSINWDSPNARKMVFGQMVEILKEQEPNLTSILILGLGGGTMQHLISKDFPEAHIVSVDIDQIIVDIAKTYFNVDQIPNHRIIVEDACRVIVEPKEHDLQPGTFDALVVDIYLGDKYPDLGKSGNFFAALKRMLAPEGLVIFNRIYLESHQEEVDLFVESVGEFFSNVNSVTVAGKTNSDNILIYARSM
ncbi:MAG TPA: hypothetical protein VJG85_02755 [Patescibacteria group bacterium]|nr:hypothetical protein [Patescibacteria group bacterium]